MNSYDLQVMRSVAAPNPLSQTAIDLYTEYAKGFARMSGGAKVNAAVLPLIVIFAQRLDALTGQLLSARSLPTVDNDNPSPRKQMSDTTKQKLRANLAKAREAGRRKREAELANA